MFHIVLYHGRTEKLRVENESLLTIWAEAST